VLAGCAGVREVACCVQEEGGEKVLAAHLVPAAAPIEDFAPLAAAVRTALPEYMVPARFACTSTLPRTVGGKIDRKALPKIATAGQGAAVAWQPATAAERALRDEFVAVLRVAPAVVAADSDFFALGGDSLRAAMLVSRLRRQAGYEAIAVRDVYVARTPAALAARVTDRADRSAHAGSPGSASAPTPAGPRPVPPMPWAMTAVQLGFLAVLLVAVAGTAWGLGFVVVPWLGRTFSLTGMLLVGRGWPRSATASTRSSRCGWRWRRRSC
jgi:aryl carrier-like protein